MIRLQSVKMRLTLWYALVLSVFLAIFSIIMYAEMSRALYRDAEKNLYWSALQTEEALETRLVASREVATAVDRKVRDPMRPFDPSVNEKINFIVQKWSIESQFLSRSLHMIRIVGLDHQELISNLEGWEKEIIFPNFERDSNFMETGSSYQTIYFNGKPFRLYYRLLRVAGKPALVIQCGYALAEIEKTLQKLAKMIGVGIPLAVMGACFAGWFLARRFFRPVDQMTREAMQITAAHFGSRLPRTFMGDEIDRLAETLNEMIDRLEHSTRAMREFSSDVSHELKTPLAIIRGELDLATRKARTREEIDEALAVIGEETDEMIQMVHDLMILMRSDARQLHMDEKQLHAVAYLETIVERFHERAAQKGVQLLLSPEADFVFAADESHFRRVMNNLIDNALKFTDSGGKVEVSVSLEGNAGIIEVRDTGIGISPENQSKIFVRFFRDEKARSREGSGLGLSIVKAICDAHKWRVGLESIPGQGTKIRIIIPMTSTHA